MGDAGGLGMSKQIHFEIFVRRGASPGWSLIDAQENRDGAIETAKAELASGRVTGVKVVKETYDDATGDFAGVTIFEDGTVKAKAAKPVKEGPPTLPCLTPDDLYSAHARHSLARLFGDTLARWKMTPTELIHSAAALEKLEATGTLFQHAVQKVALAQAGDTGDGVVPLIRAINDLADRAIQRVYREERTGRIPAPATAAELVAYAVARAPKPDGALPVGMAFAKFLGAATGWDDKLDRTLAILAELPAEGPAHTMLGRLADATVGEILGGAAALHQLLGQAADLGSALIAMSDLYLARVPAGAAENSLSRLAAMFGADRLLDARTAIGRRVVSELKTHKRLGATVDVEMLHLRAITSRLVMGPPRLVPHDDIVAAVTLRSRHLVQTSAIEEYLKPALTPAEQAQRLLALEENITGAENKRRIWDFLKPILTSAAFETTLSDPTAPPLARLARAADLQKRLLKAGLPEACRQEGATLIDTIARRTLDAPRLTAMLRDPSRGAAAAQALKTAIGSGSVPAGACAQFILDLIQKQARAA